MALSKITNGGVAASGIPSGGVIQTVSHIETGIGTYSFSGTARTYVRLITANAASGTAHISATITPSSTSSKILIMSHVFFEPSTNEHETLFTLFRDSTQLGSTGSGNRPGGMATIRINHGSQNLDSTPDGATVQFIDSPSSTSAITYSLAFSHSSTSGTFHLNKSVTDSDTVAYERGTSSIILQEIAG
jgi:hypothetical protein